MTGDGLLTRSRAAVSKADDRNTLFSMPLVADYFKYGPPSGPWTLPQTVYKWTAIAKDIILNIQTHEPSLKVRSLTKQGPATRQYGTICTLADNHTTADVHSYLRSSPLLLVRLEPGPPTGGVVT